MGGLAALFPEMKAERELIDRGLNSRTFTPKIKNTILGYLSEGLNLPRACAMAGVDYNNSMQRWIRIGKTEAIDFDQGFVDVMGDYGQFLVNMQKAMAGYNYRTLKTVQHLFYKDPKYGAVFQKILEAEHPEYYGKKAVQEVKTDHKITYHFEELDGDGWTKRLSRSGALVKSEAEDTEVVEAEFAEVESEFADFTAEE